MSGLRRGKGLACTGAANTVSLRELRTAEFGDGRNDFPRHADAVAHVVSSNVVGNQPEDGCECTGPSAGLGSGKLRNGVELAA